MKLLEIFKLLVLALGMLTMLMVALIYSNTYSLLLGRSRVIGYQEENRLTNNVSQGETKRTSSATEGSSNVETDSSADPFHNICHNLPDSKRVTHPLTAQEIVDSLSKKLGNYNTTTEEIFYAVNHLHTVSINRSEVDNIKIILGYHGYGVPLLNKFNFTPCEYTNCVAVKPHRNGSISCAKAPDSLARKSDIILFNVVRMCSGSTLHTVPRSNNQYLGISSMEAAGYKPNLISSLVNRHGFNMTITYNRHSTTPSWLMYKNCRGKREVQLDSVDYSSGKTKGALAYVSHCDSAQYNRLEMIKALAKYIDVDVYGKCGKPDPCTKDGKGDKKCSQKIHGLYHFYLSFENSLCQEYITEKFWDKLRDPMNMVPVAMGGLTVQEYTDLAPQNSFIHVRNFTSIEKLGNYLKYLTENPEAYNAYHKWRELWNFDQDSTTQRLPSCELCRIANEKPYMPPIYELSKIYNDPRLCSNYPAFPSNSSRGTKLDNGTISDKTS